MRKNFFFALSALVGLTIGAGVFGIPYSLSKSGIIPGLFYFFILGGTTTFLHLFLGEITLRTEGRHRLVGFAQKYLGEKGKILIAITTLLGIVGVLLAYLILGGDFLRIAFSSISDLPSLYSTFIFWFFLSILVFLGIKFIAPLEVFTNCLFFIVLFLVLSFSFRQFDFKNLPLFSFSDLFLPYGVVLFSLIAWEAIPEASEILRDKEKRNFKNVIILNTIIVTFIYLLFAFLLIGVTGKNTPPDALSGLVPFLGGRIVILGLISALITIADSFLILAIYLKNTFIYDFKIPKILSSLISCGLPLILFLLGFRSFIKVISFVGTFLSLIVGITIILIFKKAKILGDRKPEYSLNLPNFFLYLLISILVLGTISQIFYEIHR
jgi:amino acid permease